MGIRLNKKQPHKTILIIFVIVGILGMVAAWLQQGVNQKQQARIEKKQDIILGKQTEFMTELQRMGTTTNAETKRKSLVAAWGKASVLEQPTQTKPSVSTQWGGGRSEKVRPEERKRVIDAEELARALKEKNTERGAATIINDGTNEAGNFAKQLQISLQMAGWEAGGDNVKVGDPGFFPHGLTLEVSSMLASQDDHSAQEAKALKAILKSKFDIDAVVEYTNLKFPPNFMRIKAAGR